ncbi:MAG TPA: adenine deaminase [Gaiellales bacterium]|jgi:adenine deaminase|nr:adenine deaminase [Gaiellales bacterium]
MTDLRRRLAVARGDEPADLVITGGRVLSVHTREWLEADVAVCDGWIAGVGRYDGREQIDAAGRHVVPGLIDAHLHLESSMLLVDEFAKLVLPLGTTSVVADPHEIANVLGTDGVHWLADACADLPLDVFFMAPSCVPASRFESPRRHLTDGDLEGLLRRRRVLGLAEMMNFPGVISGAPDELAKLRLEGATHVDGHAPGVLGRDLQAYAAAGIRSDHEATTLEEGRERLRAGMWLLIREASGARNLDALLPLADEFGPGRIAFCTDDREPAHIAGEGHINSMVRRAVERGVDPRDALTMASHNAATWHGLADRGAIVPGRRADLLLLPDLERFVPDLVLKDGRRPIDPPAAPVPEWARRTVRIQPLSSNDLHVQCTGGDIRVIGLIPGQIVTESLTEPAAVRDGLAVADAERDVAKIVVVERHLGTGRHAVGFVRGFGLRRGAIASTVAHDAHNIVCVGVDDGDMARAITRLAELGGGMVVVEERGVRAELPLPVAGLLSDQPLGTVLEQSAALAEAVRVLGCSIEAPFHAMGFLALSVIPALKITDHGLVDVNAFEIVPLQV